MSYTILFVVALILVSGFIAYFGDILGRRMGKKRLTLFGLRPRYTAIVITTITGMLISTLALFTLIMVNSQFRRVFTQGEYIIHQSERLAKSNEELERTKQSLTAEAAKLAESLDKLQKQVDHEKALAAAARKARDAAQKRVTQLREEIADGKLSLNYLGQRNHAAVLELARRQKRLITAQRQLVQAEKQVAATEKQVAEYERTIKEQQGQIAKLGQQSMKFELRTSMLRSQRVTFRQGDEIARAVISAEGSPFGIRADVYSLLALAGSRAEKQGARVGDNGRAVNLVYRKLVTRELGVTVKDEDACVKMAVEAIAGSPYRQALVQVVCADNSVEPEQVPVEIRLWVNNLVFREGDRISIGIADGKASEGRALMWLIGFLQTDVTNSAVAHGTVPIANPGAQAQVDINREQQIDALLDVTERMRAIQGPAKVEVLAAKDIHSADTLNMTNMRFQISPLKSE
jgi:hypothetical protein